jgi:hypothetical protein
MAVALEVSMTGAKLAANTSISSLTSRPLCRSHFPL